MEGVELGEGSWYGVDGLWIRVKWGLKQVPGISHVPGISYELSQRLAVMSSRRTFNSKARRVEKRRDRANVGHERLSKPDSGLDLSYFAGTSLFNL